MKRLIGITILMCILAFVLPMITKEQTQATMISIKGIENKIEFTENLTISKEMNLLTKSNIKEETLEKMFEGTQMKGLGKYFIQAEQETGINAIYLASLACHESAYNTSNFAKNRNNLFGWQSYDSNLNATKKFETKGECILFVASRIKALYLNGENYCTDYTIQSISNRYASDKEHGNKVYKIMQKLVDKV